MYQLQLHDNLSSSDDFRSILRQVNVSLNTNNINYDGVQHTLSPLDENLHLTTYQDNAIKRKKKAEPLSWGKNVKKLKRMRGQEYEMSTKHPKDIQVDDDEAIRVSKFCKRKSMGPPCSVHRQGTTDDDHSCFFCWKIEESDRMNLFTNFWSHMDWGQRKVYIRSHVNIAETKRKTVEKGARQFSYVYHLRLNTSQTVRVCKSFFLSTFNIGQKAVSNWVKSQIPNIPSQSGPTPNSEDYQFLCSVLESLPKLPSHYCRSSSTKMYLEPVVSTKNHLFEIYLKRCKETNQNSLSIWSLYKAFDDMNLSIYRPKKDRCEICVGHEVGHISDTEKVIHDSKKSEARIENNADKLLANSNSLNVICVDVQALKQSPVCKASCIYFKSKLNVHNYTIYNLGNKNAICYWWHEGEGEVMANNFASCLMDFLEIMITENENEIVIWSDGCASQNRCVVLSNALLNLSMRTGRIIYQKYLEKGHTQMECDSVHAKIETKLKDKDIRLPSDYIEITKGACKKNPYDVKYLSHDFFKDYSCIENQRYSSIRPGTKAGEPVVTDIRALKYDPLGYIYYKLRHNEHWTLVPKTPKKKAVIENFPTLHSECLKIKNSKWKDLQDLKKIVPKDCQSFYDNLVH